MRRGSTNKNFVHTTERTVHFSSFVRTNISHWISNKMYTIAVSHLKDSTKSLPWENQQRWTTTTKKIEMKMKPTNFSCVDWRAICIVSMQMKNQMCTISFSTFIWHISTLYAPSIYIQFESAMEKMCLFVAVWTMSIPYDTKCVQCDSDSWGIEIDIDSNHLLERSNVQQITPFKPGTNRQSKQKKGMRGNRSGLGQWIIKWM